MYWSSSQINEVKKGCVVMMHTFKHLWHYMITYGSVLQNLQFNLVTSKQKLPECTLSLPCVPNYVQYGDPMESMRIAHANGNAKLEF